MTATFSITPTGGAALELLDRSVTDTTGIFLDSEGNDSLLPVVAYDEEYASSADTEGERRVRSRPQNPQRTGQILVVADNQTDFDTRHATLQQTIEQARRDGGTIVCSLTGSTPVTLDLESISISEAPYDGRMFAAHISRWQFTYQCQPYGRLPDVTIVTAATSALPVASIELPGIPGSVPALGQLTITDLAGQARDFVEWGLDTSYDARSPTPVLIDSASLVTTGYAGSATTRTGAYSSSGVIRATLITQPLAICGIGRQVSTGSRRIRARVYGANANQFTYGPIYVRLGYWLGESGESVIAYTPTSWVAFTFPRLNDFVDLDLGLINVPDGQVWGGQIEAYSGTSGDTLDVDLCEILPASRYGKIRAPLPTVLPIKAATAYDGFDQTAGNATGKVAPSGQTWAALATSDTTDFTISGSGTLSRSATADTNGIASGIIAGRAIGFPSSVINLSTVAARIDVDYASASAAGLQGVLVRVVDDKNFLWLVQRPPYGIGLWKVKASVITEVYPDSFGFSFPGSSYIPAPTGPNSPYTLMVFVRSDGVWAIMGCLAGVGSGPALLARGYDADLASGGALASGGVYIMDNAQNATSGARNYSNFGVFVPSVAHAINANKAMRVLSDRVERQPASGTVWGKPPAYTGAYFEVPPAGASGATHRLAVRTRRNDSDELHDIGITDSTQFDVTVTPRVALV